MENKTIAIIGLGYVGLPLAVEFAKKHKVIGFDINQGRVDELNKGTDRTLEVADQDLQEVLNAQEANKGLLVTTSTDTLANASIYIITVPTPTDKLNKPVFTPLIKASESVGKVLAKGDIVVYESTVYPGATEDICIPILEQHSGMTYNKDFFAGYSPERINPGDKERRVTNILKVTSL